MSVSILVVDDEPDVADLFRQRFRREARDGTYVMHFATSGEGALATARDGIEPTLIVILSDINMPGMDGLTLLGEIKQRFPDLPVIMVTAYGDDERRRKASGTFIGITALGLIQAHALATDDPRTALALMTGAFGFGQIIGPYFAGIVSDRLRDFMVPSIAATIALLVATALARKSGRAALNEVL